MALLGKAAMILSFDVVPEEVDAHDHWHTYEHLPERLSIPGFARGSRWVAQSGSPRYFAMYEVADVGVLESDAYLERLNNPSPWTRQMMVHYRGMTRGFCRVTGTAGKGLGQAGLLVRFKPEASGEGAVRDWLVRKMLPEFASRRGLVSAHLFEAALAPTMTSEQSIRGKDRSVDWVLLATGYDSASVASLADNELSESGFTRQGAVSGAVSGYAAGAYRLGVALTDREARET